MALTWRNSTATVFGSTRLDALILLWPVLLILLLGHGWHVSAPVPPLWFYPVLVTFFDMPHLLCGYWAMAISPTPARLRWQLLATALMVVASFYWLLANEHVSYLFVFAAHISVWHFIRQHQTWFYFAMRDTSHQRLQRWVNRIGIYAVTWGPYLIGQCGEDLIGWDNVNDVLVLPLQLKPWLWGVSAMGVVLYLAHYIWVALKTRVVALSGHLVWLSALLVWGMARLVENPYVAPALIIIPHSVSYFFLLYRYGIQKGKMTWGLKAISWVGVAYVVGVLFQVYEYQVLLPVRDYAEVSWGVALALSLGTIHFLHDMLFWDQRNNPGWSKNVLG